MGFTGRRAVPVMSDPCDDWPGSLAVDLSAWPGLKGIVDEDALIRIGTHRILEAVTDMQVIAEAGTGRGAVELVRRYRPNVVLIDVRMPDQDGLAAIETIRAFSPDTAVVVLTTVDVDECVHRALRGGATGFLMKGCDPQDIIRATRVVAAGEAVFAPRVTRRLIRQFTAIGIERARRARRRLSALTDRERQVMRPLARGLSNADIARTLFVSEGAVKAYVSRMLTKLDCENRVQLALIAQDSDLFD
ncbi:response regulator [Nonomuraea lactucae]|uniref:response regulator n=1 Tax=Nonomuraea lactucae TaxID=2249762 RepID=UPI001F054527|nr:response regulator transcription factor [Nonomuraea lactucae]